MGRRLLIALGIVLGVAVLTGSGALVVSGTLRLVDASEAVNSRQTPSTTETSTAPSTSAPTNRPRPNPVEVMAEWGPKLRAPHVMESCLADSFGEECATARAELRTAVEGLLGDIEGEPAYSQAVTESRKVLDALDYWKQNCAGASPGSQQHSTCQTRTAPKIQTGHLMITQAVLQAGFN